MRKILHALRNLFLAYVIGPMTVLFCLIRLLSGTIRIVNRENLPNTNSSIVVICNHPNLCNIMLEITLLIALLCYRCFRHPIGLMYKFTMDAFNFPLLNWLLGSNAILITRDAKDSENGNVDKRKEMRRMAAAIDEDDCTLIHFPEGGRTDTADTDKNGKPGIFVYSESGERRMRPLLRIPKKTGAPILIIWMEQKGRGFQRRPKKLFPWPNFGGGPIIIKVGELIPYETIKDMSPRHLRDLVTKKLLALADQE